MIADRKEEANNTLNNLNKGNILSKAKLLRITITSSLPVPAIQDSKQVHSFLLDNSRTTRKRFELAKFDKLIYKASFGHQVQNLNALCNSVT